MALPAMNFRYRFIVQFGDACTKPMQNSDAPLFGYLQLHQEFPYANEAIIGLCFNCVLCGDETHFDQQSTGTPTDPCGVKPNTFHQNCCGSQLVETSVGKRWF